jgi:hypothetical protein
MCLKIFILPSFFFIIYLVLIEFLYLFVILQGFLEAALEFLFLKIFAIVMMELSYNFL